MASNRLSLSLLKAFYPDYLAFGSGNVRDLLGCGGYFNIENPELSWIWLREGILKLMAVAGVALAENIL